MNYPAAMPDSELIAAVRERRMMLKKSKLDTQQRIRHALSFPDRVAHETRQAVRSSPMTMVGLALIVGASLGMLIFARSPRLSSHMVRNIIKRSGRIAMQQAVAGASAWVLANRSKLKSLPESERASIS